MMEEGTEPTEQEAHSVENVVEDAVKDAVVTAQLDIDSAQLGEVGMRQYFEQFPYIQMISGDAGAESEVGETTFERSEAGWAIHHYGDIAMSASAGEFLYPRSGEFGELSGDKAECTLHLRGDSMAPQALYAWVNKPLTLTVAVEGALPEGAVVAMPELGWQEPLTHEGEHVFSFTPPKLGRFVIQTQGEVLCGQLVVLEAPLPLPKTGTIYHQGDVTVQRMVQLAAGKGWSSIVVADGTARMKLVAWVAAKALGLDIEGVNYAEWYDDYYDRIQSRSPGQLQAMVKGAKQAGASRR
jgi:hypothetical protein